MNIIGYKGLQTIPLRCPDNVTAGIAKVTINVCRAALGVAASIVREAQEHQRAAASARRLGSTGNAEYLELRARDLLDKARLMIADARSRFAKAVSTLANVGKLTHHYAEWAGAWKAMVRVEGGPCVWLSPRKYGKRQSAQRAALARVRTLKTSAACAGVMA